MRIAVCAPQVPFERGGTEIVVETLVDQLRERDHEVELVDPVQVVSGTAAAARGTRLAPARPRGGAGASIDLLLATKFRRMQSGTRTRSSGSSTSFGRPTTSTEPSSGSLARIRSTARRCTPSVGSIRRRWARRAGASQSPGTSLTGSSSRLGSKRKCSYLLRSSSNTGRRTTSVISSFRSAASTARSAWISCSRQLLSTETCRWSWPVTAQIASDSSS